MEFINRKIKTLHLDNLIENEICFICGNIIDDEEKIKFHNQILYAHTECYTFNILCKCGCKKIIHDNNILYKINTLYIDDSENIYTDQCPDCNVCVNCCKCDIINICQDCNINKYQFY